MSGFPESVRIRRPRLPAFWLAIGLGTGLGCVTPGLPPGAPASTLASEAVRRAQDMYLRPDELDRRLMVGALDRLERRFDSVRFDEGSSGGVLWVGRERVSIPLEDGLDPERFRDVLGRALRFIEERLPAEDREDEDLELELLAMQGAMAALDRYSTIYSGRSTEDFRIRFSGKLKGIGSRIGRRDGRLLAITVFLDSPAYRSGLRDGDAIEYIDGDPTQPLTVSEAVGRIRGEAGTTVTLGILREEEEMDLPIVRGEVRIPSVEARLLGGRIGYASVNSMSRSTLKEFRDKVLDLGILEGLVLDLRGNTGGSMRTATQIADLFLAKDTILSVVDREDPNRPQPRRETRAHPDVLFKIPVIVLVDSATASAAEIVSGAIAPLPRVRLVGQTTYGKGVIQRVVPLPDEKLLKITVGEYRLSGDRVIHEKGIEPGLQLFPVSTENLGRLAAADPNSLVYVRAPGEDDTFPIELAEALLAKDDGAGLATVRARADEAIQEELDEYGITWSSQESLPEEIEPLHIVGEFSAPAPGAPVTLQLTVRNPNPYDLPDLWAALEGPIDYLSNKLMPLGTLSAGESASTEIQIEPPEGITVAEHAIEIHLASGSRPLQSDELVLRLDPAEPDLEIHVKRTDEEAVQVIVHNGSSFTIAKMRIEVPGSTHTVENLEAGEDTEQDLVLSGDVEHIAVTLIGPWAWRRIQVPIPEESITVIPPHLSFEREERRGRANVRVHADAPEGLETGWLSLNGQKQSFIAWEGQTTGELEARLGDDDGPQNVVAQFETLSGVIVTESQRFTAN